MANKKNEETKNTTKKKTTTNNTAVKKTSKNNTAKKSKSTISTASNKNVKKTSASSSTKNTTKKNNNVKSIKKTETKKVPKKDTIVEENIINLEEKAEFPDNYVDIGNNSISEQEKDEKIIVEEINNITKLENAKYIKNNKKRSLLPIGVVIAILGLVALFISLVVNRIVDREFLSDNTITLMLIVSIVIECFGAFIIIKES